MKDVVLYGNGSFAQLLKWYLDHDDERKVVAATVEEAYRNMPQFEGLPLIPFERLKEQYAPDDVEILLGVGYTQMNNVRRRIFEACKQKGYALAQYIHSSVRLSDAKMGEGNIIFEDTLLEPFVQIGSGNIIWYKSVIAHNSTIGNFNLIAGNASICGFSQVKNHCFIGSGAVIRDKIKIEDYTLVGAAAYAAADTQKFQVVAANKGVVLSNKSSLDYI